MQKPHVYMAADHAGFDLKNVLRDALEDHGYAVDDLGPTMYDSDDDYPDAAAAVAQAVRKHVGSRGILICGSAEGVAIAANKFDGIRAGIGFSAEAARLLRTDDDGNVLAIPARLELQDDPLPICLAFLATPFSEAPRHIRRLKKIFGIEAAE